jgi:hypothetical protein
LRIFAIRLAMGQLYARSIVSPTDRPRVRHLGPAANALNWIARPGLRTLRARRQIEHGSGLGRHRWVVERTFAWLHNRRRLLIRTDRRDDIHEAFLALACCLICWQQLENSSS